MTSSDPAPAHAQPSITTVTRHDIFNFLRRISSPWWGKLDEVTFLEGLYDLDRPTSENSRLPTVRADLQQHRNLMRVREEAGRWITRLEHVGGEAAGFAADAISVSVPAMSSFLEADPESAVNSAISIAEICSEIAEFLAEYQSAEAEYFLKGGEAGEASLVETQGDVNCFGEFPADEFPATRFMRRAGAANLALAEQMKLVLRVDRLRLS